MTEDMRVAITIEEGVVSRGVIGLVGPISRRYQQIKTRENNQIVL